MEPTDTGKAEYFHKVVDCQWACPAHTDVPEYIRLIAQGQFTEAYMVNRASNVFPGILGRVCDRPCEPACRRGRIEEKPVAICRLKRVAADQRDDITALLPSAPQQKNGKRVACIGAGPASLTVANDLVPMGYDVTIFEQYGVAGGLMRTNIPAFRLPAKVLDEEIGYVVGMGAKLALNTPIDSMQSLLESKKFDAVFVGTGAPKGKELELPGRYESTRVHIGIAWLESVAFQHVDKIGERVLIIGVGIATGTTATTTTTTTTPTTTTTTAPATSSEPSHGSPLEGGSRALELAGRQRGSKVQGSIDVSQVGSGGRLEVALFAAGASRAKAGHPAQVRVGRLVRSSLQAGRVSFSVPLGAKGKASLRRHRRLTLTVKVTLTPLHGAAVTVTRGVVVRALAGDAGAWLNWDAWRVAGVVTPSGDGAS